MRSTHLFFLGHEISELLLSTLNRGGISVTTCSLVKVDYRSQPSKLQQNVTRRSDVSHRHNYGLTEQQAAFCATVKTASTLKCLLRCHLASTKETHVAGGSQCCAGHVDYVMHLRHRTKLAEAYASPVYLLLIPFFCTTRIL